MPHYEPPQQTRRGQLVDSLIIVVLLFMTLFATTYVMQLEETKTDTTAAAEPVQLAGLPINETEREQYQKMIDAGVTDLPSVNESVTANQASTDKYDFSIVALLGTIALLIGYLGFVYRASFREYREVIEEKFGPQKEEVSS